MILLKSISYILDYMYLKVTELFPTIIIFQQIYNHLNFSDKLSFFKQII